MILAIPEYDSHPSDPAQWDRYYNTTDDNIYIQTLATTDPGYPNWVDIYTGAAVRDSMRVTDTLIRTKYSGKDYQTYLDQTIAWLADKYGDDFNDFISSDPAIMLAQQVAAALDQMSWSLDREADESYITIARLRSNISEMARYLGYKATPAVSASTAVDVTLTEGTYSFDVPIYKGHQFEGPNGLIFEADADQVIPAGDPTKTITVYQGQTLLEVFSSTGEANQRFNLSLIPEGHFLAQGYSFVTIDTVEWTEEEFISYGNVEEYELHYHSDPPQLAFGDGIVGKIPAAGSEIRVSYIATAGKTGSLAIANTITTSLTPIRVNFQAIPISVTNALAATGAADPEKLTSIKANSPRYYDAADRLVTRRDIEALSNNFSDPVYGAVSKANALSIRGVEQDQELASLIAAVTADKDDLEDAMQAIRTAQTAIKAITGLETTSGTIRYLTNGNTEKTTSIKASIAEIDAQVVTVQDNIEDVKDYISTAHSRLDFLPFHELLAQGDSSKKIFSGTLAKVPVRAGSLAIFVVDKAPEEESTSGDCDTTPGRLIVSDVTFVEGDVGKLIRIGGEYRQILKRVSSTTVEYTGTRIYGTSLIVEVYPPAVVGYDDGGGGIGGTGIDSGSISYASGAWSIQFTTAPVGLSGQYGVPIVATYQYEGEGIQSILDNATTACDTASTNTDPFSDYGEDIDGYADSIDDNSSSIDLQCTAIDTQADNSITQVDTVLVIPTQIENDLEELTDYLDEVISGECKANIVRVSFLVTDANGFYTGPSASLMNALRTYLDARRIVTVRYSVVSGAFYLIKVNMTVEIKVTEQYLYSTVQANVSTAIDELLKDRDYEEPLLRSDYYAAVNAVEGVEYSNIAISSVEWFDEANTGTLPTVDTDGNLFIGDNEILTKGTITFVEIA